MTIKEKSERIIDGYTEEVSTVSELKAVLREMGKKIVSLDEDLLDYVFKDMRNLTDDELGYVCAMRYNGDIHIVICISIPELPLPKKLDDGYIYAYVINVDCPQFSEFGTVKFEWDTITEKYIRIY